MRAFIGAMVLIVLTAATGCNDVVSPAAVLARGQQGITAIAADGSFVYWSTINGTVKRVSIDGGNAEIVVQGKLDSDPHLAVDGESVYWTNAGAVFAAPKGGGAMAILAGASEPLSDLTGVAVEEESAFVYFTEQAGLVRKTPKHAGELVTLATGETNPASPVARGASLYWKGTVAESIDAVRVMDLGGGTAASLSQAASGVSRVAVDASNVYWASGTTSPGTSLSWVSLAGGDVTEIAAGGDQIASIVGDTSNVYWSSLGGTVSVAPTYPGATAATLITGPHGLVSIAVDLTNVYWANSTDGVVMAIPKL